jgi:hypothetical protein
MPAELQTEDGRHVANVEIPPFQSAPNILIWGLRVFTHHSTDGEKMVYREAGFTYVVPIYAAEGTPGSWRDRS